VIILDRDKIFTSSFWQELFRLAETTLKWALVVILKPMGSLKDSINALRHICGVWHMLLQPSGQIGSAWQNSGVT
jgi:hypothetical protein